ncbi:hypothetical protein T4C_11629 [Trichinella pseudospiralis]|uniref:Uncharacterized protein n=1 Tax=Trichinella pseudospiralis TaxID=6337 RepID=A0A0V1K495_TRIPS|nr:hypothetical protein T4C_11629 [Trichinella pseudospiralis]
MMHTYLVKLMKQKKVKMWMTRSKSRTARRRKSDEKRHAEGICNALETVFTATCAVSDFYANKGGFKIVFVITVQEANGVRRMNNGVSSAMTDEE